MKGDRLGWITLVVLSLALLAPGGAKPLVQDRPETRTDCVEAESDAEEVTGAYAARYRISRVLARTIYLQACAVGVAPDLAFGLVATESRFDPRAVGRRDERGLLQLRLSTARTYDRNVTADALFHPETNLRLGLLHLKQEVEHFDHDWRLGLLAYSMGRARLMRALDAGRVPTAGYATRVLAHVRELPL